MNETNDRAEFADLLNQWALHMGLRACIVRTQVRHHAFIEDLTFRPADDGAPGFEAAPFDLYWRQHMESRCSHSPGFSPNSLFGGVPRSLHNQHAGTRSYQASLDFGLEVSMFSFIKNRADPDLFLRLIEKKYSRAGKTSALPFLRQLSKIAGTDLQLMKRFLLSHPELPGAAAEQSLPEPQKADALFEYLHSSGLLTELLAERPGLFADKLQAAAAAGCLLRIGAYESRPYAAFLGQSPDFPNEGLEFSFAGSRSISVRIPAEPLRLYLAKHNPLRSGWGPSAEAELFARHASPEFRRIDPSLVSIRADYLDSAQAFELTLGIPIGETRPESDIARNAVLFFQEFLRLRQNETAEDALCRHEHLHLLREIPAACAAKDKPRI